jgi:hypothetical protein
MQNAEFSTVAGQKVDAIEVGNHGNFSIFSTFRKPCNILRELLLKRMYE